VTATGLLAFDRNRVDALRRALVDALEDLRAIRCDDPEAADALRTARRAGRMIGDVHMPRVLDVLASGAMTSYRPTSGIDLDALAKEQPYSTAHDRSWEVHPLGPDVPPPQTAQTVLARIASGALAPLPAPLDAEGRAGANYTAIAIAPSVPPRDLGAIDRTPALLKAIDFISDGLPIGHHEHRELRVLYLQDARLTQTAHALTAVDGDTGLPETTYDDLTKGAVVSGYLVLDVTTSETDVSVSIGPDLQDPTQSWALLSQSSAAYSGVFFPITTVDLEPVGDEPRVENKPRWTFTKSSGAVGRGWGTWGV